MLSFPAGTATGHHRIPVICRPAGPGPAAPCTGGRRGRSRWPPPARERPSPDYGDWRPALAAGWCASGERRLQGDKWCAGPAPGACPEGSAPARGACQRHDCITTMLPGARQLL